MVRIYHMTATFGGLDNETLSLTPGLNIFTAPNEAGKSTWAAFLLAMFYGIDTADRVKKGSLPDKTKYLPWSGKPMEGVIALNWNGRDITIQRQSTPRAPMGIFTAYDTRTGVSVPDLTGENCGKNLLGVERSVFARSAFIGQNALAVTPDASLEQRLLRLATTGEETVSYIDTEKRLREWKNHIRHNKTGLLPGTEAKLLTIEQELDAHHRCQEQTQALLMQQESLSAQVQRLQYIRDNLTAQEALQKKARLTAAEAAVKDALAALAAAQSEAETLPSTDELLRLQASLSMHTDNATPKRRPLWPFSLLCGILGIAGLLLLPSVGILLLVVSAALLSVWISDITKARRLAVRRQQAENELLTSVRAFADNIYTPADAENAISHALDVRAKIPAQESHLSAAQSTLETLRAVLGDIPDVCPPAEDFTDRYALPDITAQLAQAEQSLRAVETALAQQAGALSSLRDTADLQQEKDALLRRKSALEQQYTALTLALETLGAAEQQLRSRFSPQIASAAAEILHRMTSGRYDALRIAQDMTLHARQAGEATLRQQLTLSGGTADQLYLALRLAISRLALPEGTPLILDDALVFFDDARLAETLELLKEESDSHQILLFTCQSRETDYMKKTP